jgi:hypothetical protein
MNLLKLVASSVLWTILATISGSAAAFDSGSTGAYGAMNITSNTTLNLPPDGIFHCTTITVGPGATLTFSNNVMNTPVYLLATGDVTIQGTIDVSGHTPVGDSPGRGGPGGFDGGRERSTLVGLDTAGDGCGPGGGKANVSCGVYGTQLTASQGPNTNVYGNLLLVPLIGGSGGGGLDDPPWNGAGGGGGGAILVASNTKVVVDGTVQSGGATGHAINARGGSGGAIRLVAPMVAGSGSLTTPGCIWGSGYWPGSSGRIRIDCQDHQAYRSLTLVGVASRGARMMVFPANAQALDIIEVAGTAIPVGTNAPVVFELPVNAPTNQLVKIQARNFTGDVPIRVVITPEHGPSGSFDATILQSSGNPPSANVPVIFPPGSVCQVHAWTR